MNHYKDSPIIRLSDLNSRKLIIKDISFSNNNISLYLDREIFKTYDDLVGIIRNIKTKKDYIYNITSELNLLTFNIDKYKDLFSNYEGRLFILLKKGNYYFSYIPILNPILKKTYIFNRDAIENSYYWYIRVLDTGELRICTVIKNRSLIDININ